MKLLSIVIPTIQPRIEAGWLWKCLHAYDETTLGFETIVIENKPTCGIAWNEGIQKARGDYIHLTADDLEPLPGWQQAAVEKVNHGLIPEPRVLNADGTLHSCGFDATERPDGQPAHFTRVPFLTREMAEAVSPILEVHYATDMWVSHRAREKGWQTVIARGYQFIHHWAQEGRKDTLRKDMAAYHAAGGR